VCRSQAPTGSPSTAAGSHQKNSPAEAGLKAACLSFATGPLRRRGTCQGEAGFPLKKSPATRRGKSASVAGPPPLNNVASGSRVGQRLAPPAGLVCQCYLCPKSGIMGSWLTTRTPSAAGFAEERLQGSKQ